MNILLIILSSLALTFSHLTFKDGLSTGSVTDLFFDENGIVWIGTGSGLNYYDGYRIYHYPSASSVMRLTGDKKGTLFVAAPDELFSVDLRTLEHKTISQDNSRAIAYYDGYLYVASANLLKRYSNSKPMPEITAVFNDSDNITALLISEDGIAWLGTEKGDILSYSLHNGVTKKWSAGSMVENIFLDSENNLWAATFSNGIILIEKENIIKNLLHDEKNNNTISSNFVRSICEDDNGNMWIGTFSGLDFMEKKTGRFSHFSPDRFMPESLSNSSVWVVKKDGQGTMWIGTFFGGVNYFNPDYSFYKTFPYTSIEGVGISSQIIRKIGINDDGKILVATEGGGFNIVNPETFASVWYSKAGTNKISENNVKTFIYDKPYNTIWLGTHLGGLNKIDLGTGKSMIFRHSGQPGDDLETDDILSMEDGGDSLYVGTTKGLFVFNKKTAEYRKVCSKNGVSDIKRDKKGNIWFASGELNKYSPKTNTAEVFLPGKKINVICCLSNGTLALGSGKTNDIIIFNPDDISTSTISMNGIWTDTDHTTNIIESTVSNKLLVSSDRGISIMNQDGSNVNYHNFSNGFPIYSTSEQAMFETTDGTIYIGGISGMVSFREENLYFKKRPYFLSFFKLTIDGAEEINIPYETKLTIDPDVSTFSISFLSSNHIAENASEFEYKMDGYSKKWVKIWNGENSISFTNLPHGKYILHIRPQGTDDSICREISIPITVQPHWYQTLPAKLLYAILIFCAFYFGIRQLVKSLKAKEAARLLKLRQKDIDNFKTFEKATSIVYGNIDNSDFNIIDFASEMALSRSALFEKIKSATGMTPNEFILDIRLKEGLKLLKNNTELNISDISYKTGFSSPHYFSKSFKKKYKESPLTWRKKNAKQINQE